MSGNIYRFLFSFHYHKSDCSTALYCKCISNKKERKVSLCVPFFKKKSLIKPGRGDREGWEGGREGGVVVMICMTSW